MSAAPEFQRMITELQRAEVAWHADKRDEARRLLRGVAAGAAGAAAQPDPPKAE